MTPAHQRRADRAARLYGWLLALYPAPFRRDYGPHMRQVFADMARDALTRNGRRGLARLWWRTLRDTAASAPAEYVDHWRNSMQRNWLVVPQALGLLLLTVSVSFIALNVLQYEIGLAMPLNPFEALFDNAGSELTRDLLTLLVLSGPAVGLTVFGLPMVRVRREGGELLATVEIRRAGRFTLALMALCALVLAVFIAYHFGENWLCITGQRVTC